MEQTINLIVREFQRSGSQECFNQIYEHCFHDFRYWYRHVQRHTDLDRATLLSEFQYLVFKAAKRFNSTIAVPDAFLRYFRAAAKKQALTLRRAFIEAPRCYSLKPDWDVVDPNSLLDAEQSELLDTINVCFVGDERSVAMLKLAGNSGDEVKEQLGISEFKYREAIRNIKSNHRLQRALSRD